MVVDADAAIPDEVAERLASVLLQVAGNESVRVLEALAATLANRVRAGDAELDVSPTVYGNGLHEPAAAWFEEQDCRRQLCRRIARRALRGSLIDPTDGATAFHRVDADPPWARPLLPTAVFGRFLFYRR